MMRKSEKLPKKYGVKFEGDALKDEKCICIARDFFNQVTTETITNLCQYWEGLNGTEHAFTYSERQSPTYLLPAISKVCEGSVLIECPLTRKSAKANPDNQKQDVYGYLDYWALYRDMAIAMEIKHSWYSLSGEGLAATVARWEKADEQLSSCIRNEMTGEDSYLKMNFMILPFWASSNSKNVEWDCPGTDNNKGSSFSPFHKDEYYDYHGWLQKYLNPKPNIWSYWVLPDNMRTLTYDEKKWYTYPAVAFLGHVKLAKR